MLLENGQYAAVVKDAHLYERGENKRLTAAFKLECEGKELINREWLELNDGTISEKTLQRLRKCFPAWDGSIEALDEGLCCRDVEVTILVENEEDQNEPGKWWTRIRYMDPPGGGNAGATLPESMDRKTLVSKYASRFRAISGGQPVSMPPTPSAPPRSASTPPKKAAPSAKTATLEACWEAWCKEHKDLSREQLETKWFNLIEKTVPGKDSADFTPEEWGKVMTVVEDNLPF